MQSRDRVKGRSDGEPGELALEAVARLHHRR
jgi:hypothetical protein